MMFRIFRAVSFLGLLFSAGCASLGPLLASLTPPAPASPLPVKATSTPSPTPAPTASVERGPASLRIWLPAEFNPAAQNPAAEMLAQRLADFESQHEDVKIEIRIKKGDDDGEILNALSTTGEAAPTVLPDLVLLSRQDLETAAKLGLLRPIDGLSTALDDPDWYSYAQQMAHVQNTGYGLPFLGNTLVFVYYPELGQIVSWENILESEGQLVFPAGNSEALVGLSLYASGGGKILNDQGLPMLDQEALTHVLTLVAEGVKKEIIPPSLANVINEAQSVQIYRTGSANKGIVSYLSYAPTEDGAVGPLPGLDEISFSYATGWVWALAGLNAQKQQLAAELAEFLVADDFLAELTPETGYLPTRPSIVKAGDRTTTAILESAHPIPSREALAVLGPLIQEALTRVLNGEEPEDVAASIVEKLR